jgi:hypothetical protein
MFAQKRLTHVPVMETSETGEQRLRGLLSAAKRLSAPPAPVRCGVAGVAASLQVSFVRAAGEIFGQFLTAFERSLPLRSASKLGSPEMQQALLKESSLKERLQASPHGVS